MKYSRRMQLENAYTRLVIVEILERGAKKREELYLEARKSKVYYTRFNLAMQWLLKNKVIWKVGKEYEIRTETAKL